MKRKLIFELIIVTTFISCGNFSDKVNEHIDNSVKDAKTEMQSDVSDAKIAFRDTYQNALQVSSDSAVIGKIKNLYTFIDETTKYIDSLKSEMNKLDDKDLKNTDLIKKIFLNDGVGDSVFNKVKLSYSFAIEIALADTTKSRLKKAQDIYTTETKK